MSTIRELAKTAYTLAITRPTGNAGIDVIEDAIQAAVNDHTRALADALVDYVSDADVSLESLERVAEEFRRDTGHLAPGKDEAAAVNSGVTHEERQHAWNIWVGKRRRDRLERACVALCSAGRLP